MIQPNLHHSSRRKSGSTGLTPKELRRHSQLAFLQQEDAQNDEAKIVPPRYDPEVNVDNLRQSVMGFHNLQSVVSASVATGH